MRAADLFRQRLRVKVASLILVILVLGFGVQGVHNIQRDARLIADANLEAARLLATSIATSIENGMLEGRPDIIRRLVGELKRDLKDVLGLDIYRRNGVEAFSDLETVREVRRIGGIGEDMEKRLATLRREPGAPLRHTLFARSVETVSVQETYDAADGARMLTLYQPLRNRRECQGCHGRDHQVRGVVRVVLGLEKLDADLRAGRDRQILVAILTIVGVTAGLGILMGRVVLQPIRRVAIAAREIGAGNLDARVAVKGRDEIGELGAAVNDMAERLKTAHEDLARRNAELADTLGQLQEAARKLALLEHLKGELSKFVPESVKRLLETNPDALELEKREADVSVLFLDLEGYTTLSEQLPPQRLNRLVQDYFSSFLEIIRANRGDINETAGDGLMVIFQSEGSSARHALDAASAAFQIQAKLRALNREYEGEYPSVAIRVGINSGIAHVGATKLDATGGGRWTFTASGATTNVAARLAALARGGDIMVGQTTADRIRDHYVLQNTGEQQLKNVSAPVRVYRLVPPGVYTDVTS